MRLALNPKFLNFDLIHHFQISDRVVVFTFSIPSTRPIRSPYYGYGTVIRPRGHLPFPERSAEEAHISIRDRTFC